MKSIDIIGYFRFVTRPPGRLSERPVTLVGIHLRPHDLGRYAATHASRCGVPLEIASKVILRHSNLATTQMYLYKIIDTEAMKRIENMYT